MDEKEIDDLLQVEDKQLAKLHDIVKDAMLAEELIVQNLLHPPIEMPTRSQKMTDKIAKFGGSWKFIIIFSVVLFVWITFNVIALTQYIFDPYPFILMNLILSCIAAFQAPVIMMSQNRQEEKDRERSENDYLINLKAEMEIKSLHQKIDLLMEEQMKMLFDTHSKQLQILKEINVKIDNLKK